MSLSKRQRGNESEENTDFNGINNLLRAAENLDKDRIKDLISVDKTLNKIGKEEIIKYLDTNQPLTTEGLIRLSNDMRMHGMTLFNKYPRVYSVESYKDEIRDLSQTADERNEAIRQARNEPRTVTGQVYDNTMANSLKRKGGKRRNKTHHKKSNSRRTRTRRTRKSRRTRK